MHFDGSFTTLLSSPLGPPKKKEKRKKNPKEIRYLPIYVYVYPCWAGI